MLRIRTGSVLKLLVDEYVKLASPVASEDIARRSLVKISPATVRNEMAKLEGEGYITRPHVSAGGIPSDKGYRFYVESIDASLPVGLQREIRNQFGRIQGDMEAWVQTAAAVLSRMADSVAVVTFPRADSSRLKYIQLVHLQEFLALVIIVLQETRLRQHLLPLDEASSQSELSQAANKLNAMLAGLNYTEIEAKELELTPLEEKAKTNTVSILRDVETEDALEHYVDGLRLLLSQPEFAETRRAKEVVEIMEERVLVRSMLSEVPVQGSTGVFIGEENQEEALRPFSVVLSRYGIPEEASGTIGVIGPTRMEYASAIGGVRFVSSFMSELVMGIHGQS